MQESQDATLNSKNAEACFRLGTSTKPPNEIMALFDSATLAGLVESFLLAARHPQMKTFRREIRVSARSAISPWRSILNAWDEVRNIENPFEKKAFEFRKIKSISWTQDSLEWNLFEQRFLTGLRHGGFSSEFSHGILKAFHEMAENVAQHGIFDQDVCEGLAGYHVEQGRFAFSIGDFGCGYLRSLQESDSWKHLDNGRDALRAVIHEGASRRYGQGTGEGFKELWKALSDHGANVRIRSNDTVAALIPTHLGREAEIATFPRALGSHISVCCCLGERTAENKLKFSLQDH